MTLPAARSCTGTRLMARLSRHPLRTIGVVALALAAGWQPGWAQPGQAKCSGATIRAPLSGQTLPAPVARMRQQIYAAAQSCDYAALSRLALAGRPPFTFSYGGDKDPAAYWRQGEAQGQTYLANVAKVLNLPFATMSGDKQPTYVWPAVYAKEKPTAKDWEQLKGSFSQQEIDSFKAMGSFIGCRVGISADGDWLFALAGGGD